MSNTYNFMSVGGSAKQTLAFGFKSRVLGTKFLYTCKFRVNDTKAIFLKYYLVGRLPEKMVSSDRVINKKGHYATTYMMVTEDSQQQQVLWQALKYAEAYDLRKQADFAEVKAQGWDAVEKYKTEQEELRVAEFGFNTWDDFDFVSSSQDEADDLPF